MRRTSLSTLWGTCSHSRPSGLEYRLTPLLTLHPGLLASSPPHMLGIAALCHTATHLSQALVRMLPTVFHLAALTILEIPRGFTAEPAHPSTQLHACCAAWLNCSATPHLRRIRRPAAIVSTPATRSRWVGIRCLWAGKKDREGVRDGRDGDKSGIRYFATNGSSIKNYGEKNIVGYTDDGKT